VPYRRGHLLPIIAGDKEWIDWLKMGVLGLPLPMAAIF
jgi:hypothetical protein